MSKTKSKAKTSTKSSQVFTTSENQFTGTWMVLTFFATWAVNALVIHLVNRFFPQQVVLGNMNVSPLWALLLGSALLAFAVTFVFPFIIRAQTVVGRAWSSMEMMVIYLVVNVVSLWLIARAAQIFGLGISSWMIVVTVSVVLDFLQGGVMVVLGKLRE